MKPATCPRHSQNHVLTIRAAAWDGDDGAMAQCLAVLLVHSSGIAAEEAVELDDGVNVDIQPAVHTKWQRGS
jgi:hypothetical protein